MKQLSAYEKPCIRLVFIQRCAIYIHITKVAQIASEYAVIVTTVTISIWNVKTIKIFRCGTTSYEKYINAWDNIWASIKLFSLFLLMRKFNNWMPFVSAQSLINQQIMFIFVNDKSFPPALPNNTSPAIHSIARISRRKQLNRFIRSSAWGITATIQSITQLSAYEE